MGFDPMEAKKLGDESILICFYMVVVTLQHIQQHLPSNGNSPRMPKSDIAMVLVYYPSDLCCYQYYSLPQVEIWRKRKDGLVDF